MSDSEGRDAPRPIEDEVAQLQRSLSSTSRLESSGGTLPRFKLIREIGRSVEPPLANPIVLTLDKEGCIWTIERHESESFRLRSVTPDGTEEQLHATFRLGDGEPELQDPVSLVCDRQEGVYVLDAALAVLKKFTADGRWQETYASAGPNGAPFANPRDIAVDAEGNLYVADTYNDRILKLRPNGDLEWALDQFDPIDEGEEPDEFYEPSSVCVADTGHVYVADSNQNRVVCLNTRGKPTAIVEGEDLFQFPTRVRVSPGFDGFFVADRNNERFQRFDNQGKRTGILKMTGADSGDNGSGTDFHIDSSGHVVTINPARESIVVLEFLEK
jgi:DNA-binding beta-propeller fold protein YncE